MNRYWRAVESLYDDTLNMYSLHPEVKSIHCAVLFYRHKPVSWGFSRPDRTIIDSKCCGYSVHAEVDVFRRCTKKKHQDRAKEILVFRCRRDGNLANSRCCPKCIDYLANTGIRKVIYSTDDGELEVEKISSLIAVK